MLEISRLTPVSPTPCRVDDARASDTIFEKDAFRSLPN